MVSRHSRCLFGREIGLKWVAVRESEKYLIRCSYLGIGRVILFSWGIPCGRVGGLMKLKFH